jgi:signal transduction histidine kinase
LVDSRHQRVDLGAPPDPVRVFGDFRRLEQGLVNLLSNAQKYSPDDASITVSITEADGEVRWSVTDRGHGIRPEDQARLFERFFVAAGDRREASGGVGLGLPITLLIAQAHGGRVDVQSRPGHGSTFTLAVPIDGPEKGAAE